MNKNHHHKLQGNQSLVDVPDTRLSPLTPIGVQCLIFGLHATHSLHPRAEIELGLSVVVTQLQRRHQLDHNLNQALITTRFEWTAETPRAGS
jgi:hypothetical protein